MSPDDRLMLALVIISLRDLRGELIEAGITSREETIEIPTALADRLVERLDYLSNKLESIK